jgi:hypothetical protein
MALVRLTVTPRRRAANRANAQKSTGPRTRAGKERSRLNAIRDGCNSHLLARYARLWSMISVNGALNPPRDWRFSQMPVPVMARDGDVRRGAAIREFLWRVRPFLPLGQRSLPSLAELSAFQPVRLDWRRLKGFYFVEPSHEALENTRRRISFRLKNGRIEARWKPERSETYAEFAARRLAQWRRAFERSLAAPGYSQSPSGRSSCAGLMPGT